MAKDSSFTDAVNSVRGEIKETAKTVDLLASSVQRGAHESSEVEDRGEMIANLKLCYRHLEDASMRLGKAIQAHDGGASVYDPATTVGAG